MFRKKKIPCIEVRQGESVLYRGTVEELPLDHDAVVQKSIEFFDDANPCYIHETAVRVRLIGEMEKRIEEGENVLDLVRQYSVFSHADRAEDI